MEYLRKIIAMVFMVVIISVPVYGSEVAPVNDLNQYIEIINPSIEEDTNIEVRNNFFVSFNIKEKADLYLTINKIVPVMDTIFLDKILSNEMEAETFINNLTQRVLEIRGYVENEEMTDEAQENYNVRKNEIKELISQYVGDYISEQIAYKKYISVQKEVEVMRNNTSSQDALVVLPEAYESIRLDYREKRRALKESKEAYDELFKVTILDKDPIQSEGVMPYYEKTIENIKYGAYEMVIELKNEEAFTTLEGFNLDIGPRDELSENVLIEKEIKLIQPMNLDELEE
jgi:hypothetical protein